MDWTEFFTTRLPHIYFIYGLAFFVLGLAVALEIGRAEPTRFSRAMWPLAFFGLVHGSHEWIEMFAITGRETYGFQPTLEFDILRLILLVVSFVSLIIFGAQVVTPPTDNLPKFNYWLVLGLTLLFGLGVILLGHWLGWQQPAWFAAADAWARYTLAIPGAMLATGAFLVQRQAFLKQGQPVFAYDLLWAAIAMFIYGAVGQLFVGASPLFPSNVLNAGTFQSWFGIPIQLVRASTAAVVAIFTIRALQAFEHNRQQTLAATRQRLNEEIAQRDALRQEFLQRIVEAQEDERSRIARELHDELGQVLTGLAIGLRGSRTAADNPDLLEQQLSQLEEMAVQALGNMRHIVNELRPALLDDMGLPAVLRHYIDNFTDLTGVQTTLIVCKDHSRLPRNTETILFRITQEALTNIARHARASQAWVDLDCNESHATLQIKDDGVGFDPALVLDGNSHSGWGLMGIKERAKLVEGNVRIDSAPGEGTSLSITIPLKNYGNG
jgi:signal transduction histidine kinase